MGGRYFVTGAQLGLLKVLSTLKDDKSAKKIEELIEEILDNQYIGDANGEK